MIKKRSKLSEVVPDLIADKAIGYIKTEIELPIKGNTDSVYEETVKIYTKDGVQLPEYKTDGSSGMDIRAYIPESELIQYVNSGFKTFGTKDSCGFHLKPFDRVVVETGIFVSIPKGYEFQVRPRSGLAIEVGLTMLNNPGTIDSDYRGEIGVILYNADPKYPIKIENGMRIAQIALCPIIKCNWNIVPYEELDSTDRGEGGFGHTGTK